MPSIIRPRPGGLRPWASIRHRSRYGLAETLRREYLGRLNHHIIDYDVLDQVPAAARRELRASIEGRV